MRNREEGYTILEALIAFAILSVVLVALYAAGATSLQSVDRGARAHQIGLLARSKFEELAASPAPLPAYASGAFEGTDVSWRLKVGDLPTEFPGVTRLRLQDVDLTLSWPDGLSGRRAMEFRSRHLGSARR